MFLFNPFVSLVLAFAVSLSVFGVSGAPIAPRNSAIVYNPPITYPNKSTHWVSGTPVYVTWKTNGIPKELKNAKGKLVLGYRTQGSESEHLNLDHPLAQDFPLSKGRVDFKLPSGLQTKKTYIVVLFGDSGNASQQFTIAGGGY